MGDRSGPPLSRREFIRRGVHKAANAAVEDITHRAGIRAISWIRPPFAVAESDFIEKCTRCDACIEACPHGVLFPLPDKVGPRVAGTPAMDLLRKGCHMCEGWPCVAACEPDALVQPQPEAQTEEDISTDVEVTLPRMAEVQIDQQRCLPFLGPECGACADSCPVPGALVWEGAKPHIDPANCTGCALCREACIVDPKAVTVSPIPE